jgi:hypothetical protein
MYFSGHLTEIDPDVIGTWENKLFLTFDNDWAHDDIIKDTVDLIEGSGIHATFFVTDEIPQLDRIRANRNFSLGIHPNFRPLLIGKGTNIHDEINRCMHIIPEAISCRTHGIIQGGDISRALIDRGIRFESNESIPFHSGIHLKPYQLKGPLIRLPYFWADEHEWVYIRETNFKNILQQFNFFVFDFHPIHVFLNTENSSRYDRTKGFHKNPEELIKHRFEGRGTRTLLLELLDLHRKQV